ncbi:MAG TPA: acyltransferase [Candidatus Obscuribacterales bacterium]
MHTLYPNLEWDEASTILEPYVILGQPPRGREAGELSLIIGPDSRIRSFTVIYAGSRFGARLQTGHHVMVREDNEVGDDVSIGTSATLEYGNRIGSRVRIHSGCFLERATIEDDVFLGPNVVFTDDPHPICPRYQDCKRAAHIEAFARIGANTTLLPGVRIGRNSLIGAGSVVAHDIPAGMVAAGNPARVIKKIEELTCWPGFFERPYIWLEKEEG